MARIMNTKYSSLHVDVVPITLTAHRRAGRARRGGMARNFLSHISLHAVGTRSRVDAM